MKKTIRRIGIALAATGLLALAGPAAAEEGMGVMVEKDVAAQTVTLMNGLVLRVTDATRITRRVPGTKSSEEISFAQLTHAQPFGGGLEVRGEHQIEWSGSRRDASVVVADRIEVMGAIVE